MEPITEDPLFDATPEHDKVQLLTRLRAELKEVRSGNLRDVDELRGLGRRLNDIMILRARVDTLIDHVLSSAAPWDMLRFEIAFEQRVRLILDQALPDARKADLSKPLVSRTDQFSGGLFIPGSIT